MKITNDFSYLSKKEKYDRSYINLGVFHLRFLFKADNNVNSNATRILDWMEENFKMYQYKKNNGVKYGEHELFFWCNCGDFSYFTIGFIYKSLEKCEKYVNKILMYLIEECEDIEGDVVIQYTDCVNYEKLSKYIVEEFDFNNINYKALSLIKYYEDEKKLTSEAIEKLHSINNQFISKILKKQVIINGIKGSFKEVPGGYGFFECRKRKYYRDINITDIYSFKLT